LTREVSHTQMFMKALDSLGKLTEPLFGNVKPDATVDLYFNLSRNGKDQRGPWNNEPAFKFVADPQPEGKAPQTVSNPDDEHARAAAAE
jgi:Mn-containing catalase